MQERRPGRQRRERPLLIFLSLPANGPIRIVTNLGDPVQECQIGYSVARLVGQHLMPADILLLALVVLDVLVEQAASIVFAEALAPVVGEAHVVAISAVA